MLQFYPRGRHIKPGEGGLSFGLDGHMLLKPQNPYTFLRVILAERGTHLGIFLKMETKNGSMFRDIIVKNWDLCLGILCEKVPY